ncbi:MAG: SH3 domain-containing protein [Vallitalea sp.]|jgi:hypothetical protein|nr:SH3 domain-containing protein [Vallitalea sp.]
MIKEYVVITPYESENTDPIKIKKGDTVQLGEKSNDNGPWPNWIYCISNRTGKEGWTPVQVFQIEHGTGVVTTDYDAKEMTVAVGDTLYGDIELNGWIWCERKADKEVGWVPKNCVKIKRER